MAAITRSAVVTGVQSAGPRVRSRRGVLVLIVGPAFGSRTVKERRES
jgi:hypothetical protein